jgi:hypothetical protein
MWYLTQNVSRQSPNDVVVVLAKVVVVVGGMVVVADTVVVGSVPPVQAVRITTKTSA